MNCLKVVASAAVLLLGLAISTPAKADVDVTIYKDHAITGDGAPFATPWASFTSPAVSFGTDNAWHWQPTNLLDFGATVDGCFQAQQCGLYTFGIVSDDGSSLYLNNVLNVDHGGAANTLYQVDGAPIFMNAGDELAVHMNYFEDFRGQAGLDLMVQGPGDGASRLVTANELDCTETPEPNTVALLGVGCVPLFGLLRRKLHI